MSQIAQENNSIPIKALAISCSIVLMSFIWQGNKGFNLWDEGYLWYGVQRVLKNEVPILDFLAYDPGRYYWTAAILNILGDHSIMSLRAAVAVFQALGLLVGLTLIAQTEKARSRSTILYISTSALTMALWMFPRHKLFDISISIFLIGILTYLIRNPSPRRHLITGFCVGLIAVFGRNHGVYGAIGSFGVMAWISLKSSSGPGFLKAAFLWTMGAAIGFLPIVLMAILIPGFATAFWESIYFLYEQKTTNLPLPVPWPWNADFSGESLGDALRSVLVGFFFIGTLVFAGLTIAWVTYRKFKGFAVEPVVAASAFLALPYAHYAFSRADISHLAQGIFPVLVGCFGLLSTARPFFKWLSATILFFSSFWVMHIFHPGWQCHESKQCVTVEISGDSLRVDSDTASNIALLHQLASQYAKEQQTFIAAPFWPGAYALLERKSPMWEIYPLFPRSASFEEKEIERIKAARPGFALIIDAPLDGRDDLRFKNTHPLIYNYIVQNYSLEPFLGNPTYQIYKTRSSER